MLNITDLNDLEQLIEKIDLGLIIKICLEVIFYFAALFVAKKLIDIFFNKVVSKIRDSEIKRQYSTIQFLCYSIANVILFLFFATNILGDLGVDMKPILATAGVLGVAIGFGAKRFVEETHVDALAVAVGTSHGAYKFTRKPDGEILAIDVIEKIHKVLPNTHMVMHGSSSVPQELQDLINAYGGAIPQTYGVPVEEIVRGIKSGVRKVNVDTDCRMAITGAIRKVFAENPKEFDPRKYLKPAIEEMQKVCEARYVAFGAAGHADKIKAIPMSVMAKRYADGEN